MDSKSKAEIENASAPRAPRTTLVKLDEPIQRGDTAIKEIILTAHGTGALKGLSLSKLMNEAETDEHIKLCERISEPKLFKADFESGNVCWSDLMKIAGEQALFFVSKAQKAKIEEA